MEDEELNDEVPPRSPEGDQEDVESLDPETAEMFEEEFADNIVDTSKIQPSNAIHLLPDVSTATDCSATDTTCCVDSRVTAEDRIVVAVGSCDEKCRIYIYHPSKRELILLQTLSDFAESVVDVAFSFDGKFLAAASYDATIKVYSISPGVLEQSEFTTNGTVATLAQTLEGPTLDIEWLKWHPKGYAIIAGSKDSTVWMWWATNGNVMNVFSGHGSPVSCGSFAHGGKLIVTGRSCCVYFLLRS